MSDVSQCVFARSCFIGFKSPHGAFRPVDEATAKRCEEASERVALILRRGVGKGIAVTVGEQMTQHRFGPGQIAWCGW